MNPDANMSPQQPVATAQPQASSVHVDRPQPANDRTGAVYATPQNPAPQQVPNHPNYNQQPVVSTPAAATQPVAPVQSRTFVLPYQLVSKGDLSRSLRELSVIDDYFHQAAIRGSKEQVMPTLGKVLDSLARANQLNMLKPEDRAALKSFLTKIKQSAPVVYLSLPSEPSAAFLAKILEWFRTQVHPYTVLSVGMQPSLVAGCLVRTTNKSFDFSFRKKFDVSKEKLMASLSSMSSTDQLAGSEPAQSVIAEQISSSDTSTEIVSSNEMQPTEQINESPQVIEQVTADKNTQPTSSGDAI